MSNRLNILGVGVDAVRFDTALKRIGEMVKENRLHHIVTVNPEFVMHAKDNKTYRTILNRADLATADGFGLRLAASFLNTPITWIPIVRTVQILLQGFWIGLQGLLNRAYFREIPELVTGVDLVWALAKLAEEKGYSIYLLDRQGGLAPDTPQRAVQHLKLVHPHLKVVGAETVDLDDRSVVNRVRKAHPDFLFVAFGFPFQEQFVDKNRAELGAKVAIGVGGTLDYIVGNRARPPRLLRGKFEWLWRLVIPSGHSGVEYRRRVRRILTAFPLFPLAVLSWKLHWGAGLGTAKALALDFGGVTNQNGVETVLKRAWLIVPPAQLPALAIFYLRYIPFLERGDIAEVEVWTKFMSRFGTKQDLAALRSRIIDGFTPNESIWNIIKDFKNSPEIDLALLTNNIREWMSIWERRFQLSKYFPTIIASCFERKRKPNPAIFRVLIRKLGLPPHEIVFVDDHYRNVIQARRLGFRAIRCTDPDRCADVLGEILPIPLKTT